MWGVKAFLDQYTDHQCSNVRREAKRMDYLMGPCSRHEKYHLSGSAYLGSEATNFFDRTTNNVFHGTTDKSSPNPFSFYQYGPIDC